MRHHPSDFVLAGLIGIATLAAAPATAQQLPPGFPTRPVTFVNPLAPGGSTDALARTRDAMFETRARGFVHRRSQRRTRGRGVVCA